MSEQRIHVITAAHALLPSLHAAFSTEGINQCPRSDVLPRRRIATDAQNNATSSMQDDMDVFSDPAYTDTVRSNVSGHSMLSRSFSVPTQDEYNRQLNSQKPLSEIFHDLVMSKTYTVKNLEDIKNDDEEISKLYRLTMVDLYDNPDYTDSLVSSSSKAALLSKKAIELSKAKQRDIIDQAIESTKTKKEELKSIMKNLVVLSAGVMCMFCGYSSMRNLQTSINTAGGLGVICLSVLYLSFFLGCIVAPLFVRILRPKPTLLLAFVANAVYVACNFYPNYYTMVPGSVCVGFFLGNLWTAHGTYLTSIAIRYAQLTNSDIQRILTRFNAITFMFFQMANIFGGLISSLVLSDTGSAAIIAQISGNQTVLSTNITYESLIDYNQSSHPFFLPADNSTYSNISTLEPILASLDGMNSSSPVYLLSNASTESMTVGQCGSGFCPGEVVKSSSGKVSSSLLYILLGIYLGFAVLSVLLTMVCLNRLEGVIKMTEATLTTQLMCVFKFFFDKHVMLLLGLMFFTLPQVSFMYGEFTKAFVTCSYGVSMVGFTMVTVSVLGCTSSLFNALLHKYIGRAGLFCLAAAINLSCLVAMLLWKPTPDTMPVIFVIGAFWGIADGVWFTQLISLFGYLFSDNKEAAFAGLKMCQSLGVAVAFGVSDYLCTRTKIWLLILLLVVGMVGYLILELMLKKEDENKDRERKETAV